MFKKITIMLMLALLVTTAGARDYSMTYHEIQVIDELGRPVTDITNLYIYGPGTTVNSVIYMDRNRQKVITIPMLEGGLNNSTLVDGYCYWWGPDGYDFSMTNTAGVGPEGNTGHLPRTGSDGTIVFPSYLHDISTVHYLDGDSITMGTENDWVINGGFVADTISFVPASDNASFIVGSDDINESASFYVYISATEGWFILSTPVPSASWTGGVLNCNVSSDYVTNINTGTSTGGTVIGNALGGLFSVDTASTITLNADTTIAVSNDAGDQTYTLSDGSFTILATEDATETFHLHVDGGVNSSIFIVNETGTEKSAEGEIDAALQLKSIVGGIGLYSGLNAADAIRLEAHGGAAGIIMVENYDGTGAAAATDTDAAIQLYARLGGIGLYSLLNGADAIRLESNGGVTGTINIHNNLGTAFAAGAASIQLLSDDGAIGLKATTAVAAGALASAIQLTATVGAIELSSGLDATNAIKLTANGGVASDIDIWNDTGNTADSIHIVSDLGGLDIDIATGATMDISAATDGTGGFKITTNIPTGQDLYGGLYTEAHLEGTTNGTVAALRVKTSLDSDSIPGNAVYAARLTIEEVGANQAGGTVIPLIIETFLDAGGNDPGEHYMMRFNTSTGAETPDAWFQAGNKQAVVFAGNAAHSDAAQDKIGAIKIQIAGIADFYQYIYLYSHPGQ